jgi:hypothetical protein
MRAEIASQAIGQLTQAACQAVAQQRLKNFWTFVYENLSSFQ